MMAAVDENRKICQIIDVTGGLGCGQAREMGKQRENYMLVASQ